MSNMRKLNELSKDELGFLDKVVKLNTYEENEQQRQWNVVYGYLNNMFNQNLLSYSREEIKTILQEVNSKSPSICKIDEVCIMRKNYGSKIHS